MAVAEWSDNGDYYVWRGEVWIPKNFDPTTKACVIMLGPPGGTAMVPAMVQGDPGKPFVPRNVIINELAHNDPSDATAQWVLVSAATDTLPPVMDLQLSLHRGQPGADGTMTILAATDLDTGVDDANLVHGYTFAVDMTNPGDPKVALTAPKVGGMYWPTAIQSTNPGDGANRNLAPVSVPAQPWPWRPRVSGQCHIAGDGPDVRVDLVVRTNQSSGEIVGRTIDVGGQATRNLPVVSGPPTNSVGTYGLIPANTIGVITLRTEQQAGVDDYATSNTTTTFAVEVAPVP